jgi:hypothetical protein
MTANVAVSTHVRLHHLTYVDDVDGVMVGRPDTGSYGLFPPEGADLLRSLATGATLEAGARRWHDQTGQTLDTADFVDTLTDLGFMVAENEAPAEPTPVRWQRLSRMLFSMPAWVGYLAVMGGGLATMILDPGLRPSYRNVFFTSHIALIPVVLALTQIPLLLLHEGFHALAARRRGLPSTLGIGRRFYYLVAETRMDSLYSVPRAQRYLPFLAGAMVDAVGVGVFTMASAAGHHWGAPPWLSGLALTLAFSGVLRILWEFLFYLQTDFYFVVNTASRCTDLHGAAKHLLRTWFRAALRRPPGQATGEWSDRDLAAARWYAPMMIAGYGVSLCTLVLVGIPTAVRFWTIVVRRLDGSTPQTIGGLIDTAFFILFSLIEFGLLGYVTLRDLRRRRARRSVQTERNAS